MLKRYDIYSFPDKGLTKFECKDGQYIKYEDHIADKQSEKEELKMKVEEIIQYVELMSTTIFNQNDYEIELKNNVHKQLKSLIGE